MGALCSVGRWPGKEHMQIKSGLVQPEVDRLRTLCNFSDEEDAVFALRVRGKSVVEIHMGLNMSEATVKRRLRAISQKIDKVSHI